MPNWFFFNQANKKYQFLTIKTEESEPKIRWIFEGLGSKFCHFWSSNFIEIPPGQTCLLNSAVSISLPWSHKIRTFGQAVRRWGWLLKKSVVSHYRVSASINFEEKFISSTEQFSHKHFELEFAKIVRLSSRTAFSFPCSVEKSTRLSVHNVPFHGSDHIIKNDAELGETERAEQTESVTCTFAPRKPCYNAR